MFLGTFLEDAVWLRHMFHMTPLDISQIEAIFDILSMLDLKDSPVALIKTDDMYGKSLLSSLFYPKSLRYVCKEISERLSTILLCSGSTLSSQFEVEAHKKRILVKGHISVSSKMYYTQINIT